MSGPFYGTTMRSNISYELEPGLRHLFFNRLASGDSEYQELYTLATSETDREVEAEMHGLGLFYEKPESTGIRFDSPGQAYKKEVVHKSYALGFRVTVEAWKDQRYGTLKKMPAALADSGKQSVEYIAHGPWNGAFTTSLTADGKPVCATDHPIARIPGMTYANRPVAGSALTLTAIKAGIINLEKTLGHEGRRVKTPAQRIMVTPDKMFEIEEILQSEKEPYTSDNQINSLRTVGRLKPMINHYITNPYMFFILSSKDIIRAIFYWREMIDTQSTTDFYTGDLIFKATMRFSMAIIDWRGIYGNPGPA